MSEQSWAHIDKFNLDEECDRQVGLKLKYGKLLAEARESEALAKNELKVVMAEVDKEVRADPKRFGIAKPSEKAFENAVLLDLRVQSLIGDSIRAGFEVDIREAQVYALSDRKSMLEKEVDLFLSGYFSRPNTNGKEGGKNWSERRDQKMEEFFDHPTKDPLHGNE